jgi:hypothetical protein
MTYKQFEIVFDNDLNKYFIIDSKYNQKIQCASLAACKLRITKLVKTRQRLGI